MGQSRVHLSKSEPTAYKALDAFSREVGSIAHANGVDERLKELVLLHCSQLNGCAYCARIHSDRALAAGVGVDDLTQLPAWRESGVFSERERAALELAEAFTFIHRGGLPDDVYDRVGAVLTEKEYLGVSWLSVSINAFNRVVIAGRYAVPPREAAAEATGAASAGV
ncbi:carboxymuconolactone decarboxylase family protein [Microbacterium marinilacus]|uniref:Carboxymuconolactone decarboxylase family protein n=1 Tax=Microbacterium marinilacus TaxID=415209 RepID=A0ABP7B540_9MICO|nr:carboxymuconolactone decarboxylase family protein [Microbacterium marinilacus]MBY0690012.1 carboxymuconolactone decarboxylase family protein [Microbacterium marinilacus]